MCILLAGWDALYGVRSPNFPNAATVVDQAACCAACDADYACYTWVYSTDPVSPNCWPLESLGDVDIYAPNRVLGGALPPPPAAPVAVITLSTKFGAEFLGSGSDLTYADTLPRIAGIASVAQSSTWTPSFWCSDGWSALAVSPFLNSGEGARNQYPVSWDVRTNTTVDVYIQGGSGGAPSIDLYLTPARTLREHVTAQAALEGLPAMLPRYALGFLAGQWGWRNQSYIEDVLFEFKNGGFPIDVMLRYVRAAEGSARCSKNVYFCLLVHLECVRMYVPP